MPPHPTLMPALDRALDFLADQIPLAIEDAANALYRVGLTSRGWDPRSILSLAADCKRKVSFDVRMAGKELILIGSDEIASDTIDALLSKARKQAGASGTSCVEEVVAEMLDEGIEINSKVARQILKSTLEFLDGDWFWIPDMKSERNRLRNVIRKMLSVCPRIEIRQMRDGVRRHYRHRQKRGQGTWRLLTPPARVIAKFSIAHPEFKFDGLAVEAVAPIDWRLELAGSEEGKVVQILFDAYGKLLRRETLFDLCSSAGMTSPSFSAILSGSPVVRQLATGVWGLRGFVYQPGLVESVRSSGSRLKTKRVEVVSWTEDGPVMDVKLPHDTGSFVVGIPASIRPLISDSAFDALLEDGSEVGKIRIASNGSSWGYGRFIRRVGADPGDVMRIAFDLGRQIATLDIVEDVEF